MFLNSKLRLMDKAIINNDRRPHHRQYDDYTLYLAVRNYAKRLYALQIKV